jgi:hypothetical protein
MFSGKVVFKLAMTAFLKVQYDFKAIRVIHSGINGGKISAS